MTRDLYVYPIYVYLDVLVCFDLRIAMKLSITIVLIDVVAVVAVSLIVVFKDFLVSYVCLSEEDSYYNLH